MTLLALSDLFRQSVSIDAKRKIDGEKAESRQGETVSTHWLNERFRQTLLLIREFRYNWVTGEMLTNDDIELLRICLDVALGQAARQGHTGDIYDGNAVLYSIWLVQHLHAVRAGSWTVESANDQSLWSTANMYAFLEAMHARGDTYIVRDPTTRAVLHRYRLPFRAMTVPPRADKMFIWKKAARRLSQWMVAGGLAGLDEAIITQRPPSIVPPLPAAAAREERREALWARVAGRARRRPLFSVRGNDADAQETRQLVSGVMSESRAAAGGEGAGLSDEQADELEADLEREMTAEEAQPSSSANDDEPLEVTAERVGPDEQPVFHISQLLDEIREL